MFKFCPNLSYLFQEKPFLERYAAAKQAGFQVVESGFPFGYSKDEVVAAKNAAGVEQISINSLTGDITKGERGYAAIPGMEKKFKESIVTTTDYAKALGVKKIHIMSGSVEVGINQEHDDMYVKNLKYAAKLLKQANILGIIESINNYLAPTYYMNSYEKAIEVINAVNSPYIKLQLDIYHLQLIKGNITNTIQQLKPFIGHIQIAQAPNRNEPDSFGEINYKYVFEILQKVAEYTDWIALEYNPLSDTVTGLKWVQNMGLSL